MRPRSGGEVKRVGVEGLCNPSGGKEEWGKKPTRNLLRFRFTKEGRRSKRNPLRKKA